MNQASRQKIAGGYDQAAAGYDAAHETLGRKYQRIEASTRALLKHGDVLDLGCGTGRLMRQVSGGQSVGIDISLKMLKQMPRHMARAQADGHRLPFASECFDAVVAAQGVIRYMDLTSAMTEVFRVLRPGGRFATHQFGSVFSLRRLRRIAGELDLHQPEDLTKPALAAGFTTIEVELWRPIRAYPYAVRVPSWLPGRLWTHCIARFEKPAIAT